MSSSAPASIIGLLQTTVPKAEQKHEKVLTAPDRFT
jgi:hypothetical protein